MTVRELLHRLIDHAADGRLLEDEIMVKINGDIRSITASYSDGTMILIAGRRLSQ